MCRRVVSVSVSGFYAWLSRKPSLRSISTEALSLHVVAAHERNRGTYGNIRLQRDLANYGINIGEHP